jgi:hypothetical protein
MGLVIRCRGRVGGFDVSMELKRRQLELNEDNLFVKTV